MRCVREESQSRTDLLQVHSKFDAFRLFFRILTHNLLTGPKGGYPLELKVEQVEELEVCLPRLHLVVLTCGAQQVTLHASCTFTQAEFDEEYVKRLIPKIEWNGVLSALSDLHSQGTCCWHGAMRGKCWGTSGAAAQCSRFGCLSRKGTMRFTTTAAVMPVARAKWARQVGRPACRRRARRRG